MQTSGGGATIIMHKGVWLEPPLQQRLTTSGDPAEQERLNRLQCPLQYYVLMPIRCLKLYTRNVALGRSILEPLPVPP